MLHATDETVTEFAVEPYAADAPLHVVALRTPEAKLATYSNWASEQITPLESGQERELYDYSTHRGRLELENVARGSPLEAPLGTMLGEAYHTELRRPLPPQLRTAAGRGFYNYFNLATQIAARATQHRAERQALALERHKLRRIAAAGADGGAQGLTAAEVPITVPALLSAWTATKAGVDLSVMFV